MEAAAAVTGPGASGPVQVLVRGDEGVRFENAVATMLLKQAHFRQDARGKAAGLHYIRTKDGAEVDRFVGGKNGRPSLELHEFRDGNRPATGRGVPRS